MTLQALAFDRSSVRSVDPFGKLHIAMSNISKAMVCPYYGHEIPNADGLGLNPDKVYHLLRDPAELAAAAHTFNNLPVLSRHVPVTSAAHMPELVVGSTGTDAEFTAPYLRNSAVIWADAAIAGIETNKQREWSSAYAYVADMTPGTYEGLRYDGIMRNIVGNHVALVESGRAGPDVVVGDSQIQGPMMFKSRRGLMMHGALMGLLTPVLAQDATLNLRTITETVTKDPKTTKGLADKVMAAVKGKLAADGDIDVDDVVKVIAAVEGAELAEPDAIEEPPAVDADDDAMAQVLAFLKGKLSDEDLAQVSAMCGGEAAAEDEEDPDLPEPVVGKEKPAMDRKAVKIIAADAQSKAIAAMSAIRQAERDVRPYVGEITVALDSAAAVYRLALDAAKVDLTGVHESAFPALVKMLPLPDKGARPVLVALDAATADAVTKRFPNAARLKHI
jgi:hypothetical protein